MATPEMVAGNSKSPAETDQSGASANNRLNVEKINVHGGSVRCYIQNTKNLKLRARFAYYFLHFSSK